HSALVQATPCRTVILWKEDQSICHPKEPDNQGITTAFGQRNFHIRELSIRTENRVKPEPNELVAQIHPRMPGDFFLQQHHAAWLGEADDGNLKELLVPYPADQMRMWEISPRVNSAGE